MKIVSVIFFSVIVQLSVKAQSSPFNFRHLTTGDGLSDGIVRAIVQDKYGFIWVGTSYGLNRFDGIVIKSFFSKPGDSTSLSDNYIQSLYCDSKGNLWIGTFKGLSRYDYGANRFINYGATHNLTILDIKEDPKGNIWLASSYGLWKVNQQALAIQKVTLDDKNTGKKNIGCYINKIVAAANGNLFLATNCGIKIFNPATLYYDEINSGQPGRYSISGNGVYSLAIDSFGYLWAACAGPKSLLNKIDLKNHTVKLYDHFIDPKKNGSINIITNVLTDKKGRLWAAGSGSGLSLYDEKTDSFYDYRNDPIFPNSIIADQSITLYQDQKGIIWIGTSGYGLSYFNPESNLFYTLFPTRGQKDFTPNIWCRAACEDKEGNLWLGTAAGVAKYDLHQRSFIPFANEGEKKPVIYSNSVRSLLEDDNGDIWIGTASGLNRYHPATGAMDFFDIRHGIPLSFFWMLAKTNNDQIWFGSAAGLYHYIRSENHFDDLAHDPLLSNYAHRNVQALFTDSRNRLWIGLLDIGIIVYDEAQKKITHLTVKDSLITDTRFSSFAEDKNGIIWIGSENGLTAYDPVKNSSRFFNGENGLPSNRTNNLMVDSLNRLWIGTSNGLCVMNSNRTRIRKFDINDGLLTTQFNEQSAFRTRGGLFVFPTYKGFVMFRPEDYKNEASKIPFYITSFKVSGKELNTGRNTEDLDKIHLRYDQNFFSVELAGLNYMNPFQCTYAYKLEHFDKDWKYTSKKEINYTNVPPGDYIFRYKVITDNSNFNVEEKSLPISIAAVFYETWWFKSLVLLIVASAVIGFYRYRIHHREKILILQSKAQLLEKEKALVMYESLKQQLNPHFLFNSLTSLSSLIQQDQKMAKQFLDQMSKIYRYILTSRDSELVPLIEDIKLVQVYTQLQQTRFQKGLCVDVHVSEENYHRKIVPVTLQNLIENAIKHNVIDAEMPLGITIFVEDDYLVVRNNLQRKNFVETSNKQGLANMKSLYHYLSGKTIIIDEGERYFTVKIPLI